MASKTFAEFMEIITAKRNEKLAAQSDNRSMLSNEERMEIFHEVSVENSTVEEDMTRMIENLKEIKTEENNNDNA